MRGSAMFTIVASRTSINWQVTIVARMSPGLLSLRGTTSSGDVVAGMDSVIGVLTGGGYKRRLTPFSVGARPRRPQPDSGHCQETAAQGPATALAGCCRVPSGKDAGIVRADALR